MCCLFVSGKDDTDGIAESYGNSIFNFWQAFILFSVKAQPVCIPTNSDWGSFLLHISASTSFWPYSYWPGSLV